MLGIALDGEPAVPCTRNPLQRGRTPLWGVRYPEPCSVRSRWWPGPARPGSV